MRILVAEDDDVLADGITRALKASGYCVDHAETGTDAIHMLLQFTYNLVVLDLGLPGKDGLDILKEVRDRKDVTPVLILTARDTLEDRISGLDLGADDYMAKPFKLRELEARIRALLRRSEFNHKNELTLGDLRFDITTGQAYIGDEQIELHAKEMKVLELLLTHQGKVISKSRLIDYLYSIEDSVTENAIEVYVSRVRKKVTDARLNIKTIRGIGYMLEVASEVSHVKK